MVSLADVTTTKGHEQLYLDLPPSTRPVTWGYWPHGPYEVSSRGLIVPFRGKKAGKALSVRLNDDGYPHVSVKTYAGVKRSIGVHILVCEAFRGPRPKGYHVNHRNGDKTDFRIENLEFCTPRENVHHAMANGLVKPAKGSCSLEGIPTQMAALWAYRQLDGGVPISVLAKTLDTTEGVLLQAIRNARALKNWSR